MEASPDSNTPAEDDCPICMDTLKDPCRLSSCTHVFCRLCLTYSLTFHCHCPVCRAGGQISDIQSVGPTTMRAPASVPMRTPVHQRSEMLFPGLSELYTMTAARNASAGIQSLTQQMTASHLLSQSSSSGSANQAHHARTPPVGLHVAPRPTQRPTRPARTLRSRPGRLFSPSSLAPNPATQTLPDPFLNTLFLPSRMPNAIMFNPLTPTLLHTLSSFDDEYDDSDSDLQRMIAESNEYQTRHINQHPSPSRRTFVCPYCQESSLAELNLRDHCIQNHRHDNKSVVCPVCVSLPHGNPHQHSRNFIGHLNLRHSYHSQDYTNVDQSDMMNEQDAILYSCRATKQSGR